MPYRGRFAPSPTGPLHFGSLVAALASWLDARHHGGTWYVRIEDLDPPRTVPGAAQSILETLRAFGLEWDGEVLWQSQRTHVYRAHLDRLRERGLVFPCQCSRRQLALEGPHRGRCAPREPGRPAAWRLLVDAEPPPVHDRIQGVYEAPEPLWGDLVLWRVEDLPAYHLAVVIDDAEQGITDIVRGADLLDSTPAHRAVQRALGLPTPRYAHIPVAIGPDGAKLSKQNLAPPLDRGARIELLRAAWRFLGQEPAKIATLSSVGGLLTRAIEEWRMESVPRESARLP